MASVTGDLVVMTDDDAVPHHDWLVQLRNAADSQPSFSIFGGSIVPLWEMPPESWIIPFCPALTITDPSWEEGPIVAARIYGPNMAVRSKVIDAGYRFDVWLGPTGSHYQMGDEADFLQRISKAGFSAWYCKAAVVEHIIRDYQMNKRWMLRRAKASGRAMYRWEYHQYDQHLEPTPTLMFGAPRYIIREIVEQMICTARAKLMYDPDTVFKERWKLHYLIGRALGGRMLHSQPRLRSTEDDLISHAVANKAR